MLDLKNKIVLITGASSGIGKACAYYFAEQGCRMILTARRLDRIQETARDLKEKYQVESLVFPLDVQNKKEVQRFFANLPPMWVDIDILINNAGLALDSLPLQEGNVDHWDIMIDTNVKGLLYMTREVLKTMVPRNAGHIINVGSISGRDCYLGGNVYCATKHAVAALNRSLRLDLLGKAIRVTEIAPGAVHTEFSEVRWNDKTKADDFYKTFQPLSAEDIADAILYCATRPLHIDVSEMVIYPTVQASVNHLHRR